MNITNLYFSWWLRPGKTRTLTVDGLERTYVVHTPNGLDSKTPTPVVLALHGATMNGPMMAWFTGLNSKADEAGFIAVYPNGTGTHSSLTWNGGNCCGSAMQNNVDDVAFINALLDDLIWAYQIDSRRIYATGMSNGAIMAYRLGSELSDRIAAIAPVAGSIGIEVGQPKNPVSVLHFHGTQDEFVPFTGGKGPRSITGTDFRSVEDSIQAWVRANECEVSPINDLLADSDDGLRVTRRTYGSGRDGSEVSLVVIEGGGHTWPGMKPNLKILGKSTLGISANDMMWDFFARHPKK